MLPPSAYADRVKVRMACHDDAEVIREIYNREVVGSTVTFDLVPRTLEEQLAWLDGHSGAHPAVVASGDDGQPGVQGQRERDGARLEDQALVAHASNVGGRSVRLEHAG